jgi:hypothetical protein
MYGHSKTSRIKVVHDHAIANTGEEIFNLFD